MFHVSAACASPHPASRPGASPKALLPLNWGSACEILALSSAQYTSAMQALPALFSACHLICCNQLSPFLLRAISLLPAPCVASTIVAAALLHPKAVLRDCQHTLACCTLSRCLLYGVQTSQMCPRRH